MTLVANRMTPLSRIQVLAWGPLFASLLYLGLGVLRMQLSPGSTVSAVASTFLWLNTCFFFLSGTLHFLRKEIVWLSDENEHICGKENCCRLSKGRWNMMKSRAALILLWIPASFGVLLAFAEAIISIWALYAGMKLHELVLTIMVTSFPIAFLIYGWIIHWMLNDIHWLKQTQKEKGEVS